MIGLEPVAQLFSWEAPIGGISPIGSGHINDTYLVQTTGNTPNYILQRINHQIFKNPASLMDNICRVTEHLFQRLKTTHPSDAERRVIRICKGRSGKPFVRDEAGNYWRAYPAIEETLTHDQLTSPKQAREAALAFGRFGAMLADFPAPPLVATIPDFHNGPVRFAAFVEALEHDAYNRAKQARTEIQFLQEHADILEVLPRLQREGLISERVTHNDTKINNVLMDQQTGEGLCVIDLDTVMPGLVLYDFGDMVRTSVGNLAEDAPDTRNHALRLNLFEGLLEGFALGAGDSLNLTERQHLAFSGQMMALLIGTRFLTDFLTGDTYFKVHHPTHNLERCRVQFSLVRLLMEARNHLEKMVERAFQHVS